MASEREISLNFLRYEILNAVAQAIFRTQEHYEILAIEGEYPDAALQHDKTNFLQLVSETVSLRRPARGDVEYHDAPPLIPSLRPRTLGDADLDHPFTGFGQSESARSVSQEPACPETTDGGIEMLVSTVRRSAKLLNRRCDLGHKQRQRNVPSGRDCPKYHLTGLRETYLFA